MAVYSMFGVMMFTSKLLMEGLPNIHLIGMFTVLLTVVYRKRALYPIYIFVFLTGAYNGFLPWWIPYLYIWTVLWGVVMLLPRELPRKWAAVVYPVVCSRPGLWNALCAAAGADVRTGLARDARLDRRGIPL